MVISAGYEWNRFFEYQHIATKFKPRVQFHFITFILRKFQEIRKKQIFFLIYHAILTKLGDYCKRPGCGSGPVAA